MEFECGGPVVAVREGRVLEGKFQVMNSSETFTLVLSKKDIMYPEAFGNEIYANMDPAYIDQHGEIARLLEYEDTEECVYKGDRGNILYFTTKSCSCDKTCDDLKYLISIITHGPLSGIMSTACKTIVWIRKMTDTALDYVLIQDDAFQNIVKLARPCDIPQYIEDYVRKAYGHTSGFQAGIIRNGVFERLLNIM